MYKRLVEFLSIYALVTANNFAVADVINIGPNDVTADCTPAVLTTLDDDVYGKHDYGTVTLMADWVPEEYTVTYAPGNHAASDASNYTDSVKAVYNSSYDVLELDDTGITPEPGYSFVNWQYVPEEDDYPAGTTINPYQYTSGITLTAQWKAIDYTVSYNCDTSDLASHTPDSQYNNHVGDPIQILTTQDKCAKAGYTFASWNCTNATPNENGEFTMPADNVVCTAHWNLDQYHVTYACGDGSGNGPVDGSNYTYSNTVTTQINDENNCVRPGYTFDGWECAGNNVAAGSTFTITSDTTCTAQWKLDQCDITYELNSNSAYFADDTSVPYNYDVTSSDIVLPIPVRDGFEFVGWYENSDLSGNVSDKVPVGSMCDKYFYAKWEFKCEPEHWFRAGQDRICMYETQQTSPTIKVDVKGNIRYLMLTDEDPDLPMNKDSEGRKMRVKIGDTIYNVHDKSVLQ